MLWFVSNLQKLSIFLGRGGKTRPFKPQGRTSTVRPQLLPEKLYGGVILVGDFLVPEFGGMSLSKHF